MEEANRIATLRNKPKMDAGIVSNLFGRHKFDELTPHLNGVMAEMAVSWYLGLGMDKSSRLDGDKGAPDLLGLDGATYEVKYTDLQGGDFIVPDRDPLKFVADIGIVCHPGFSNRRVRLSAWVTSDDFLNNYHVRDYGSGDRAAISQSKMRDIGELKEYIYGNISQTG